MEKLEANSQRNTALAIGSILIGIAAITLLKDVHPVLPHVALGLSQAVALGIKGHDLNALLKEVTGKKEQGNLLESVDSFIAAGTSSNYGEATMEEYGRILCAVSPVLLTIPLHLVI